MNRFVPLFILIFALCCCDKAEAASHRKKRKSKKVKVPAAGPIIDLPRYGPSTFNEIPSNGKKGRVNEDKRNFYESPDSEVPEYEYKWGRYRKLKHGTSL